MGINYSCDRQRDIIFLVWDGKVTWDNWLTHIHKLQAEPDWSAISRVIADLQTANDTSSMGNREIDQAADIFGSQRHLLSRKRIAVIARDEFGKSKRFGDAIAKFGAIFIVFSNLNTACLFLGIDEQEARQKFAELRASLRSGATGNVPGQTKEETT